MHFGLKVSGRSETDEMRVVAADSKKRKKTTTENLLSSLTVGNPVCCHQTRKMKTCLHKQTEKELTCLSSKALKFSKAK